MSAPSEPRWWVIGECRGVTALRVPLADPETPARVASLKYVEWADGARLELRAREIPAGHRIEPGELVGPRWAGALRECLAHQTHSMGLGVEIHVAALALCGEVPAWSVGLMLRSPRADARANSRMLRDAIAEAARARRAR